MSLNFQDIIFVYKVSIIESVMAQKSAKKGSLKEKAVPAALALAADKGWAAVSLNDIARKIRVPLAELHEHFEDRADILTAWGRQIDKQVLEKAGAKPDPELSPRDRLFDVMMTRLEILSQTRAGARAILKSFKTDPKQAVIELPHLGRSMSWMLEAAGIETGGLKGSLKIAGLLALYIYTLRVWQDDDSADLGKTMAALDRNLGRAEEWAKTLGLT